MSTLSTELRNKLERTIVQAREVAEAGAKAALEALAVHHHEPYGHMSPEERKLRNHLRAKARQLGDKQNQKGELGITHLVWECAYEHWHRMLFARFLAENDLLIEPEMGVSISLEECEELAKEEGKDLWTLASEFAQLMLPQIFRPNDPVLRVMFASEHRMKLEKLLNDLEPVIFTASDSLGWVYQFWQSKRKKEVNESGNKIGADELPAVTQLFTEPYMVSFLLDNSLGAWWAGRRIKEGGGRLKDEWKKCRTEADCRSLLALPGVPLEYLRFIKLANGSWAPAAGTFDGWPDNLSELKTLDPCCGSGHFMVAAFLMLVVMRMELEGLSVRDACEAVLRENLHGLEIDKRCVELAAFALALSAWSYPDAGGFRPLPELNVACSGLAISAKKEEWLALAGDNNNLRMALKELYKQFKDAPVLGSLINPEIGSARGSLFDLKWEEIGPLLTKALSGEKDDEKGEMGIVAQGITKAASLLSDKYNLVFTNVPYLKRGKQIKALQDFGQNYYSKSKDELATIFWERCHELCFVDGISCIVMPHYWMFHGRSFQLREYILENHRLISIVVLGAGAFETISGEVVNVGLFTTKRQKPTDGHYFIGLDVTNKTGTSEKGVALQKNNISQINQKSQEKNPDKRLVIGSLIVGDMLSEYAETAGGMQSFDKPRFIVSFTEIPFSEIEKSGWVYLQSTINKTVLYGGRENLFLWENGQGQLFQYMEDLANQGYKSGVWRAGVQVWGKKGVLFKLMGERLEATIYTGQAFENTTGVLIPKKENNLAAIWCYCSSDDYSVALRQIDKKLAVTNGNLSKVPFDHDHWTRVAREKYPNGLPKPCSDDPTQWIFHGYLSQGDDPLQVAVARLLGYRWPAEIDKSMELSDEAHAWVKKSDVLLPYADKDGIVCIPSVRGEESAADRLRELLRLAFGADWQPAKEKDLIQTTGVIPANLDEWLRDYFFEQHCKFFHHRPFIWHIWDGRRRDGFHALVNYHKLAEGNGKGRQLLENLTYSYLGDWITRQKEGVRQGEGGAEDRLAAALELQKRLIAILEGEPPFDIFIRWKPIEKQPIGWEPDVNDGVRLNIRPFMAQDIPGGRKGAGILRWKPNIKWNKDRGKDVPSAPWFPLFKGDRINDHHLSLEEKRAARDEARAAARGR